MKNKIKVGSWYSKYTENEKRDFLFLYNKGNHTINDIRRFLSSIRKQFKGEKIKILKFGLIITDKKQKYCYCKSDINNKDNWHEVNY